MHNSQGNLLGAVDPGVSLKARIWPLKKERGHKEQILQKDPLDRGAFSCGATCRPHGRPCSLRLQHLGGASYLAQHGFHPPGR